MKKAKKDIALVISLCKDIARHVSQLEAENNGIEQTERYLEFKNLLVNHYLQGEDNFDIIIKEFRKSMQNVGGWDNKGKVTVSAKNHTLCILDYFLMLTNETSKE